ncbi:Aspartic-type endopeptidase ctsD [Vanrija pseudolonga]|uniref:Aspartic-type endopeptidase ctsD n=1 Tax=Vanrija pseudolonga TaxID=143232 RepID=A0AAF1BLK7_9TREE|nr:Aspartic-type endopeptidase ctsD [Vanrija pseudolonga]
MLLHLAVLALGLPLAQADAASVDAAELRAFAAGHAPARRAVPEGYLPRPRSNHMQRRDAAPVPGVGVSAFELHVREHVAAADEPHAKRAGTAALNGSIIALGSAQSTYVVPIAFGNPPVAYPLQLDTGSSDLLLASTLCGSNCPSAGQANPYYDASHHSSSFVSVNGNGTRFTARFADRTVASGFAARELVGIGHTTIDGQVFGLVNSTNLTLSSQQISGMIGFGFPRLSLLARSLLTPVVPSAASTVSSTSSASVAAAPSSGSVSASASASAAAPTGPPAAAHQAYLPTLLESLVTIPEIQYPVFALGLSPPPRNLSANATSGTLQSVSPVTLARYQLDTGSLTIGGVSEEYVSENTTTGRTLADIEWWPVVPFGPALPVATASLATTATNTGTDTSTDTATDVVPAEPVTAPALVSTSDAPAPSANGVPNSLSQLEDEQYLYWTVALTGLQLNGTAVGLNSSYASIGVPSLALLDIGTNGIYGPQQDVVSLFSKIPDARQVAAGQWAVPCNTKATLGFSFGGRYVQLQPDDWIYAAVSGSSMCLAWPVVAPATGDGIDWQLGTPFLKNVYTVFSYGINGVQPPQVGFLPIRDAPAPPPPATGTASAAPAVSTFDLAAPTVTINTVLPNALLPNPSHSTPSYIFASAVPTGAQQAIGLGNSSAFAVSAVPIISLPRNTSATESAKPPGWPGGSADHTSAAGALDPKAGSFLALVLMTFALW